MIQARAVDGRIVEPQPGIEAVCPLCETLVIPKCGQIVVWHFAHKVNDCDPWAEPETEWHREWKYQVWPENREVTIRNRGTGEVHRADMLAGDGTVIELQHSPISVDEIVERESFYARMRWVFDVADADIYLEPAYGNTTDRTFRWKHPRKHIAEAGLHTDSDVIVYLDLGYGRMLRLHDFTTERPAGGSGELIRKADFVAWLNRSHHSRPRT